MFSGIGIVPKVVGVVRRDFRYYFMEGVCRIVPLIRVEFILQLLVPRRMQQPYIQWVGRFGKG